jgi:cysteine desulfurase
MFGEEVLAAIPHVAASTGSACHAGTTRISPVLAAMGVPHDVALGAVRFSLGRHTTNAEIRNVVDSLTAMRGRVVATK